MSGSVGPCPICRQPVYTRGPDAYLCSHPGPVDCRECRFPLKAAGDAALPDRCPDCGTPTSPSAALAESRGHR